MRCIWRLASADDPKDQQAGRLSKPIRTDEDEFPYRVEIRNYTGDIVEQTLAITKSRAIGFAAYYTALEELPDRLITLRAKGVILAQSDVRKH